MSVGDLYSVAHRMRWSQNNTMRVVLACPQVSPAKQPGWRGGVVTFTVSSICGPLTQTMVGRRGRPRQSAGAVTERGDKLPRVCRADVFGRHLVHEHHLLAQESETGPNAKHAKHANQVQQIARTHACPRMNGRTRTYTVRARAHALHTRGHTGENKKEEKLGNAATTTVTTAAERLTQ